MLKQDRRDWGRMRLCGRGFRLWLLASLWVAITAPVAVCGVEETHDVPFVTIGKGSHSGVREHKFVVVRTTPRVERAGGAQRHPSTLVEK